MSRSSLLSRSSGASASSATGSYASASSGSSFADPSLPPLLYVAISCEGVLRAERAVPEAYSHHRALRAAAWKAERGLQRSISFCSKEEKLPQRVAVRGNALGVGSMAAFVRLPSSVTAHVLRRHGHTFVVLALPGFEADLASRFCEAACNLYGSEILRIAQSHGEGAPDHHAAAPSALYDEPPPSLGAVEGGGNEGSATASSSSRWSFAWRRGGARGREESEAAIAAAESSAAFGQRLEQLLRDHGSLERLARLRRVREVAATTQEVAGVMEENIERLMANGQNLEHLEDKSQWLLAQATAFQRSARAQRRLTWCRYLRVSCCAASCCAILIAIGVLLILQYTGILHLWGEPAPPPPPPPSAPSAPPALSRL